MTHRYLIVASETPDEREARRQSVGAASDETYADTLRELDPDCSCRSVSCVDGTPLPSPAELAGFDAAFFSGSPIEMASSSPETRSAKAAMLAVLDAGLPVFGSCAGLQIAVAALGGRVKKREPRMAAGFTRGIVATDAGRDHPMLRERPIAWDAPAMHFDETAELPQGAVVLAEARTTFVQAVEMRRGEGLFWGVQYHPELTLQEIAASIRRQAEEIVETGLVENEKDAATHADRIEALGREPDRKDLLWMLGLDREVTEPERRMRELSNFLGFVAGR
ncbi:glutamine amidotransferase-related protein [Aureimonas psammosilenae]|uniref:glutamine amidotransferase-related protein n=1 Tax=Aureimonas psammosilenae TaxID=2495496 RepID=UPI0012604366|nr:gamma-glutamyl-gamma-aminobutyrate hydrolase family protein [Aureimonas psammosilenae]